MPRADAIMANPLYPYSLASAPTDRTRYAYSAFAGEDFLAAWRRDRSAALSVLCRPGQPPASEHAGTDSGLDRVRAEDAVEYLWANLSAEPCLPERAGWLLGKLLQRFEVSLRLHEQFDLNFRPLDCGVSAPLTAHLRLGEIFSEVYRRDNDLRFLSVLSKLIDGLIPAAEAMTGIQSSRLAKLIESETGYVDRLMARDLPATLRQPELLTGIDDEGAAGKRLDGVVVLAARTARSQAYVQAIARAGMRPEVVIVYGTRRSGLLGQRDAGSRISTASSESGGLFLPDLGESIEQTATRAGWDTIAVAEDDINSATPIACLRECRPRLTVFSGYGGQIVGDEMLATSPFLHAHAGRLPEYRGSTTIYYSWLAEGICSVTTFLLSSQLDQGQVLHRKDFPPPPSDLDVDYVYDNAIRADCLVETLANYSMIEQLKSAGGDQVAHSSNRLYYIIHPLLKHVAIIRQQRRFNLSR